MPSWRRTCRAMPRRKAARSPLPPPQATRRTRFLDGCCGLRPPPVAGKAGSSRCCGLRPPPVAGKAGSSRCCGLRPPPVAGKAGSSRCCGLRPPPVAGKAGSSRCCGLRPPPVAGKAGSSMKVDLEAVSRVLREMRSSGATLDQIAGRLRLGPAAHKPLRTSLQKLVQEGTATYHGKRYRPPQRSIQHPAEKTRTEGPSHGRRKTMPAALLVAQSQRRAGTAPEPGPPQPGHEIVGTLHLKTEGYGFVSP